MVALLQCFCHVTCLAQGLKAILLKFLNSNKVLLCLKNTFESPSLTIGSRDQRDPSFISITSK